MRSAAALLLPARLTLLCLTLVVGGGSSVASGAPAPGLVGAYSFDAGTGANVTDESGNGNDGMISGATWTSGGRFGGALSFNGTNDWVEIGDAASLDLTNGMTLAAWVKPSEGGPGWRTVLSKERNRLAYGLYASDDTGRPAGLVYVGDERTATGSELPPGVWSHLATTFDGVTLRVYVNGSLSDSTAVAGSIRTSSGSLRLGGNSRGSRWFEGQIDEVRIYNRALSSAELQTDATTPISPPPADAQPPTAPSGLAITGQTTSSITLSWNASSDNVAVAGYGRYRGGVLVNGAEGTTHTYSDLACGTSYTLGVDAYDAAGNRSPVNSVTAATSPCADTSPPSGPTGVAVQGQTQTTITVGWNASSDNVGVTGYGRYREGGLISSGAGTSYTFSGLVCGTSYSLAVDAFDAAGNRSARTSITASTDTCPPPSSSLVAAYSFDAGSGSTLADTSGHGNTGSIEGATWTTAGRNGGALSFDGVDDLVTIVDARTLDLTTGMTLEAWVRPIAAGSWRTVVTKEQVGNLVYGLFSSSNAGQPAAIVSIGASPLQDIVRSPNPLDLSTWTHLATTYDGALLRLYVNGVQVASETVTGSYPNSAGPLQIGGNRVWPEWFQGQIDDLRVYNRALTAGELAIDMNTPVGGGSTPPPPPPPDTQAPTAPGGLAVGGQTQNSFTLTWNAATDNVAVTGYGVYRNGASVGSTGAGTRSFSFTGLACGTTYSVAVDATDAAGNRSARSTIDGTTTTCPPPPPPPPPGSGLAQVWVDVSGGSCVRSGSPVGWVDGLACGSVQAAYAVAQAGDTVLVAAGTYGRQLVPAGSKPVMVRSAPGAVVVFGTTSVEASNLTLVGVRVVRNDDPGSFTATLEARGSNNVFDGVDVDSRNMPVRQGIYAKGDNTVFRNGSSFNVVDEKGAQVSGSNVTFDNMDFHDVLVTHSAVHNECIYSLGPGLTVRNSRFWNCATMDLFVTRGDWYGQPLYGNVTIENNVFAASRMPGGAPHYYSLGINGGVIQEMRNWRVVNNTFEIPASGGGTPAPGTLWANNLGDWSCYPGATFTGNVGKSCSPNDRAASMTSIRAGWADPSTPPATDFHLTPNSPAINAANPTHAPPTDKDGNPRNGPPDAGAYEYWP